MDFSTCVALNNGKRIPILGLGVWNMKDKTYEAVRWALDAGYRHLDCASVYGNEADVGRAIRDSGIPRDELFLTSKLFSGDVRNENVDGGIAGSLERLGTDYLDLYLIHWPIAGKYVAAWKKMEVYAEKGVLRSIGLSNFHPHHYQDVMQEAKIKPVCVQLEIHPYLTQRANIAFYQKEGVAVEAWSPLGGTPGSWNNDVVASSVPDRGRSSGQLFKDPVILAMAEKYGKSAGQIIIRWHLQRGVICIPKSVHKERIIENSQVFDFSISDADMAAITALDHNGRVGADPDTFKF